MFSRGRSRRAHSLCAAVCVLALSACGDTASDATQQTNTPIDDVDAGPSSDASTSPSVIGTSTSSASSGNFTMQLSVANPRVCKGDCTTLSAQLTGGIEPYTLRWSHNLPAQLSHQVCPSESTDYVLDAQESASAHTELSNPRSVSARISVQVDACSTPVEPDKGGSTLCRVPLSVRSIASASAQLSAPDTRAIALDPQGNSYLAVDFAGAINVGATTLSSDTKSTTGTRDVLLAKIDNRCGVVWSKRLGGSSGTINAKAIAADAQGNVVLVGTASGRLDFGAGLSEVTGAFVAKWSSTGELSWLHSYGMGSARSVSIDPQGNVLFTAEGPTAMDFGGGPMMKDVAALGFGAVKLDAQGQHLSTHGLPIGVSSAWINAGPSGVSYVGGTHVLGRSERRQYIHKLESNGQPRIELSLISTEPLPLMLSDERAVSDVTGNVVISYRSGDANRPNALNFRTFNMILEEQTRGKLAAGDAPSSRPHALAANRQQFAFAVSQHGSANNQPNDGAGDLLVSVHDHPSGTQRWSKRLGDARNEWPLGLAFGTDELVVLSAAGTATEVEALILTRLAAD